MKMAKKLIYFDGKGRAESLRYMLHYGGIKFEDERIPFSEWPSRKNNIGFFGKVPIFVDGDLVLNQSMAIARYIGRGLNLVPTDPREEAAVDAVILTLLDYMAKVTVFLLEQDATKKEALKKELLEETIPFYFSRFDKILEKNRGHVGKELTWADFVFAASMETTRDYLQLDMTELYPNINAIINMIQNLPNVKEYIARRKN